MQVYRCTQHGGQLVGVNLVQGCGPSHTVKRFKHCGKLKEASVT
jgi:hypothetical protein